MVDVDEVIAEVGDIDTETVAAEISEDTSADVPEEALKYQLDDVSLTKSTTSFLEENGVTSLVQLVSRTKEEILEMDGFKDKIITEIEKKLSKLGLGLHVDKSFEAMDQATQEKTIREMEIEVFIANDVPIPTTSQKALEQKGVKNVGQMMDLGKAALKGKLKFSGKTIKTIEKRLQEWGLELKE